jgi:hypothetical protein
MSYDRCVRLATVRLRSIHHRVWLDDVYRVDPVDGSRAGPNVHLWVVEGLKQRQILLFNESTHHRIALDARNIRQFDEQCPGMPPGAMGAFRLRSPVILSGCNAFKSLAEYRTARRTRPQIFLPVSVTSPEVLLEGMALARLAASGCYAARFSGGP